MPNRRLTQEAVEVAETGANRLHRLTQIVVEVAITQPVHPFGEQPFPEYPPWSPAYITQGAEKQEHNYASFFGIHRQEIILGRRRRWLTYQRR